MRSPCVLVRNARSAIEHWMIYSSEEDRKWKGQGNLKRGFLLLGAESGVFGRNR